jgi:hypothetical protein
VYAIRVTHPNRVFAGSKATTIRLQPRDVEHVEIIKEADRLGTRTEAIQRALEHYARALKRRSAA